MRHLDEDFEQDSPHLAMKMLVLTPGSYCHTAIQQRSMYCNGNNALCWSLPQLRFSHQSI